MMERIDRTMQEDFIWAMRTRTLFLYEDDSDSWKEHRLSQDIPHLHNKKEQMPDVNSIKLLASLLPDELLYDCKKYVPRMHECCILVGEIQGFHELTYNKFGGPSYVTQILCSYIGSLVHEIITYGGDVLCCSGGIIMGMWKNLYKRNYSMQNCAHLALDCGLIIQKTHSNFETKEGFALKIKLGVTAGQMMVSLIGTKEHCTYVAFGDPLWEAKAMEDTSGAGEIFVSASAWDYMNHTHYQFLKSDKTWIKVIGISRQWRSSRKDDVRQGSLESLNSEGSEDSNFFEIREAIRVAVKKNVLQDLRKFFILPILRAIDMNEGLDYLTEMRYVVILVMRFDVVKMDTRDYVEVIDTCYQIINAIVIYMEGSINRVKTNELDFTFEIIFGLRGYKHQMESQLGLSCANSCFKAIRNTKQIRSRQVAVTSGLSYCGAIGHKLRTEYTVLSAYLYKAHVMVMAFSNKVVCDRETFLYSRLEASHFVLQDYVAMPSVIHAGPIYEYVENVEHLAMSRRTPIAKYPALDRDMEVSIYGDLVTSLVQLDREQREHMTTLCTAYIIFGAPRQGKTRLLDEFLYITPSTVPVYPIKLVQSDKEMPYYLIRMIFSIPLGLTEESSYADRATKLISKLRDIQLPKLLCVLNKVFKVDFMLTDLYFNLSEKGKKTALDKIIKQLTYKCFSKVWVISIDNGEYISDESWCIIKTMMESRLMLFVVSVNTTSQLSPTAKSIIEQQNVLNLTLGSIEKWYQTGIACQVLNVQGIQPELEKVIQKKSNGNPGWIENFLISLVQSSEIHIMTIPLDNLPEYGLVIPNADMLRRRALGAINRSVIDHNEPSFNELKTEFSHPFNARTSEYYQSGFDSISGRSVCSENSLTNNSHELTRTFSPGIPPEMLPVLDKWKLYKYCFRDSKIDIKSLVAITQISNKTDSLNNAQKKPSFIRSPAQLRYSMAVASAGSLPKTETMVNICLIMPGANLEDIDPDVASDAFIMKIFDSLTSFDQFLLKCSCVIGDCLPREMLIYVMNTTELRTTAMAVKKMFELDVLGCAQGDFFLRGTNAIMNSPKIDKVESNVPYCKCVGLKIRDECMYLPKYANCGYMRFKIPRFKDTVYNLLTSQQKKDFHAKAVRYLEKKTRKCRKCGEGFFIKIMGVRYDEIGSLKKRQAGTKLAPLAGRDPQLRSAGSTATLVSHDRASIAKTSRVSRLFGDRTSFESLASSMGSRHSFDSERLSKNDNIIRSFSNLDFTECECPRILDSMYKQMLIHCEAAGQIEKWLSAVLEYANLCIDSYNSSFAMKILNKALKMIEEKYLLIVNKAGEIWKICFLRAKVLSMLGKAHIDLGQLEEAHLFLNKALKEYGFELPSSIKMKFFEMQQTLRMACISRINVGIKEGCNAEYSDNVSDCLSLLYKIFEYWNNWPKAEITANASLCKALESEKDFVTLTTAFTNMLSLAIHFRKTKLIQAIEIKSLMYCRKYRSSVDLNDLNAIFQLYCRIYVGRLLRGEISKALNLGNMIMNICNAMVLKNSLFNILPLHIQALTLRNKMLDAASVILHLEYASSEDPEFNGLTWFYALSIGYQLDTGYTIIPFRDCEEYYVAESKNVIHCTAYGAEGRYYAGIWLWYLRSGKFEEAVTWEERLKAVFNPNENLIVIDFTTAMYYLEGLILNTIHKMDKKNLPDIEKDFIEIECLIYNLYHNAKDFKVILPRLALLKAYYKYSKHENYDYSTILKRARKLAQTQGNVYDENWIDHNEHAWNQNMSAVDLQFWAEHADAQCLDYHELENNDCRLGFFSLLPPLYV